MPFLATSSVTATGVSAAKVVATGGWAELVGRETEVFDVVDPDLTLHGVRLIYEANKG